MPETAYEASAVAAEELDRLLTEVAKEMEQQLDSLSTRIADEIHAEMPEFGTHARVTERTRAAVRANLAAFAAAMRSGVPTARIQVPPEVLDYAHAFVHRGLELPLIMRVYRLGHALMWKAWHDAIESRMPDAETRSAFMDVISTSMFDFVDQMTVGTVEEYLHERSMWTRSGEAVRSETVASILEGEAVDLEAAGRALGYELRRWHVGMVLWDDRESEGDDLFTGLQRTANAVCAEISGGHRPLVLASGGRILRAWIGTADPIDDDALMTLARGIRSEGVTIALGEPGQGLEGFRRTHEQAQRCRRVMRLVKARPGQVQRFNSVALTALLTSEIEDVGEYVRRELGDLAADDDATARLRATLIIYMDEGFSAAKTGRRLSIHTNTVNYRVRRCAELRGRPVRERRVELEVALLLRQTLRGVSFDAN